VEAVMLGMVIAATSAPWNRGSILLWVSDELQEVKQVANHIP